LNRSIVRHVVVCCMQINSIVDDSEVDRWLVFSL
jgi:hypothetical protein